MFLHTTAQHFSPRACGLWTELFLGLWQNTSPQQLWNVKYTKRFGGPALVVLSWWQNIMFYLQLQKKGGERESILHTFSFFTSSVPDSWWVFSFSVKTLLEDPQHHTDVRFLMHVYLVQLVMSINSCLYLIMCIFLLCIFLCLSWSQNPEQFQHTHLSVTILNLFFLFQFLSLSLAITNLCSISKILSGLKCFINAMFLLLF